MNRKNIFISSLLIASSLTAFAQDTLDKSKFQYPKGNLHLSGNQVQFNYIKDTEIRSDTMAVYNDWSKAMEFNFKDAPEYLICKVIPSPLPAGQEGMLVVTYDAIKRNDYGFSGYNLGMYTNDESMPIKTVYINAYIEEDFSLLTEEEKENPPRIVFKEDEFNFGSVKAGEKVKCSFEFSNTGKRDLIVRKTKASCGCTATQLVKKVLKPGESSKIDVVFDTRGRSGKQHKTIFVISNDQRHANYALRVVGNIIK